MRKVRAFCGIEKSGKDYSVKRLVTTMGFKRVAFADLLREMAFNTIGMDFKTGMERYEELKETKLINDLTFRNILENLGSSIRKYDENFLPRAVVKFIGSCVENVAISDLRYPNEYWLLKKYCEENKIDFKLIFCDYHSEKYNPENKHESTAFANYLKGLGYKDQEYVKEEDIVQYDGGKGGNERRYG